MGDRCAKSPRGEDRAHNRVNDKKTAAWRLVFRGARVPAGNFYNTGAGGGPVKNGNRAITIPGGPVGPVRIGSPVTTTFHSPPETATSPLGNDRPLEKLSSPNEIREELSIRPVVHARTNFSRTRGEAS